VVAEGAGATFAQPIARLKPGVSLEQAHAELAAFSASYRERFPARLDANNISEPRMFVDALVSSLAPTMYTLMGAVACVLFIACANVASLYLSRLLKRRKEIAVRLSIGARRAGIIRLFLAESLLFSTAAGVLGTLFAVWTLSALQSVISTQVPPNTVIALNWRASIFTIGLTVVSALVTGVFPAIQVSRPNLAAYLKDSTRGTSGSHGRRFRQSLIVGEVMLSVVLLVGAVLLLASFVRLQNTAPGFEAKGAAAAFVSLPSNRYGTPAQQADFFDQIIEQLKGQPGVTEAAVSTSTPLSGFAARTTYGVVGRPLPPLAQRPIAGITIVSNEYFRLMRIPIVQGRAFNTDDRNTSPAVCIVNESFARRVFADEPAVGQSLMLGRDGATKAEVVGVIRDVKSAGLNAPAPDEMFFPLRQTPRPGMNIVARTAGDPAALQAAIRSAVAAVDKTQAISFFSTLESNVTQSLGTQQLVATLTSAFAALALTLALTGLYSVLAYAVSQRTPEIGIRIALGATKRQVLSLVMRDGFVLVGMGLVLGLAAAAGVGRLIRQLLFGVEPLDAAIYGAVAVTFAAVSALACLVPAIRAARVDPLITFRTE
jgi:predicted permease